MARDGARENRLPPWLVGLLIAAVVFAGVLFAFHVLGFGDTPGLEGGSGGVIF